MAKNCFEKNRIQLGKTDSNTASIIFELTKQARGFGRRKKKENKEEKSEKKAEEDGA